MGDFFIIRRNIRRNGGAKSWKTAAADIVIVGLENRRVRKSVINYNIKITIKSYRWRRI